MKRSKGGRGHEASATREGRGLMARLLGLASLLVLASLTACERRAPSPQVPILGLLEGSGRGTGSPAPGPLRAFGANPRFLSDGSGKPVWLAGAHTWNNVQDWGTSDPPPALDFAQYLGFLRERGLNFTRLWTWEQSAWVAWESEVVRIAPVAYARTGPGLALDGGPRFDLRRFDQGYFDRLRQRVRDAADAGVYVSVMLFNGWSLSSKGRKEGNPWRGHPFHRSNNVSGIDGDPNRDEQGVEVQTLLIPAITELQKAYVVKVVETLGDCDNVIWEISNESEASAKAWQYEMILFVRSLEAARPKRHPIGMTATYPDGGNEDLFGSPADWIAPRATTEQPYADLPAQPTTKVVFNDTDHIWGIGGNPGWVWKSLAHGMNALFMDPYKSPVAKVEPVLGDLRDAAAYRSTPPASEWELVRANLGFARAMALRCRLETMAPADHLVSPGCSCLADPGREYLVYVPAPRRIRRVLAGYLPRIFGSEVTIDLAGPGHDYAVEWLGLENGDLLASGRVAGGGRVTLFPPSGGEAVLRLYVPGG